MVSTKYCCGKTDRSENSAGCKSCNRVDAEPKRQRRRAKANIGGTSAVTSLTKTNQAPIATWTGKGPLVNEERRIAGDEHRPRRRGNGLRGAIQDHVSGGKSECDGESNNRKKTLWAH